MLLHADSEDSDQTGRMTRLTLVFAGRTDHFVGCVMRRLICNLGESNERARFCVLLASQYQSLLSLTSTPFHQ